ncbi:hypothetical protein PHLCEN_2v8538 [Hermanssonia centrifuga]|uniref:Uncharacterized protein n=1 Tax=Hermanssonia centrifuga TaxID=98765 RepID=A0A2R6NTB6_9APHY|nr:hypothetical protein PHLCEN_2v8538 [Hermanssonia centrifuga]
MSHIGSVFLGDVQRHQRILSTPPSSPPPATSPHSFSSFQDPLDSPETMESHLKPDTPSISPEVSLDLRIRWLETLLFGAKQDAQERRTPDPKNKASLVRRVEELQRKLSAIVQSSDGLKRFMDHYEQHAHLLTPTFALSGSLPADVPTYDNMTPAELEAFLAEMEPDIRAADRDLREIEILEKKDVTGAGKLPEYETLQPRLDALFTAHTEDLEKASELEKRIAKLMDRYATNVDTLSELFVAWDESLRDSEVQVAKLERDHDERKRLGYA